MMSEENLPPEPVIDGHRRPLTPFRVFLRGLAVTLPAILTLVILIWLLQGINNNIIQPATWMVQYAVSQVVDRSVPSSSLVSIDAAPPIDHAGTGYKVTSDLRARYYEFVRLGSQLEPGQAAEAPPDWNVRQQGRVEWMERVANEVPSEVFVQLGPKAVPYPVFAHVARILPPGQIPQSARGVYMEYVADRYFGSVIPLSLLTVLIIILLLYFIGRFVSIRVGRWIVIKFEEQVLGRLPLIRNVYGSVKQVTDFVFTENQPVEYRRVVACQYPRKGIWSLGFVTGESMLQIAQAEGEPCVAILIPTSPMPMTGFTISVPKSDVVDLNLTVEQAMQFCISCGVLTPPHQRLSPQVRESLSRSAEQERERNLQGPGPATSVSPHAQGDVE